jgi:hypothetical protein
VHRILTTLTTAVLTAASIPAQPVTSSPDQPWWDHYPRIVQGGPNLLSEYHADVVFSGGLNAPSWGIWGQVMLNRPQVAKDVHGRGGRMISYFETYGQSYCVIMAIPDDQLNTDHPKPSATHWTWRNYDGDPIYWVGAHSWFDDLPEARPWTRAHPEYGGDPMRYPDGREATGYTDGSKHPLRHRAFDAGCSKNILAEISFETHAVRPDVQENGPHTGLFQRDGEYAGVLLLQKDSACPHWLDLDEAAVRYSAGHGSDGMWSDNYSPWDSFSLRPVDRGFGEWSVALFRDYLCDHFDEAALADMGIKDLDTFDVREALRKRVRDWGGNDTNLRDRAWSDPRWLDEDLWRAYVIFKRQQGTRALDAYDQRMHAAARAVGKQDYLISGNDIPGLSLGWVRGNLDLVSTESSAGYALDAGSRGLMLPPTGRHSVRYRLAGVHARSRLVNIWPYLVGDLARYRRNENLTRVMSYEMLAAGALPMPHPGNPKTLDNGAAYRDFFAFVGRSRKAFGTRVPLARTGIYYSSSSLLAFMTPGGFIDFNRRPHQFGYYGWATALHDIHEPYVPVPEWQLNPETLSNLDLLIVPNAIVMDQPAIEDVLRPWLDRGGRLLVTGESGVRGGEFRNFARHDRGPLHEQLAGVYHVADNIGIQYYRDHEQRRDLAPELARHLKRARGAAAAIIEANAVPPTVGITPYWDAARSALFLDLNNLAIDLDSDTITPTKPLAFTVTLPDALRGTSLKPTVLSPEPDLQVTSSPVEGNSLSLTVGSIQAYCSIMLAPEKRAARLTSDNAE